MSTRVIVIGGGVIGLSVAWELSRRDVHVTLLERGRVGRATSWAAAGILPPANLERATDPIDRLRGWSHGLYPTWDQQLRQATGIDIGFRRCGGWYLADSPGERAAMMGMTDYWHELGIQCEQASAERLAEQEPSLEAWATSRPDVRTGGPISAWWVPDEHQIRPPLFLAALHRACEIAGVDVIEQAAVDDLRMDRPLPAVRVNDDSMDADAVVVCGGPWIGRIAEGLNLDRAVVPVRGQILMLKTDRPLLASVINIGNRYVMCRQDGSTLVGSCEEEVGFQAGTSEAMLAELYDFAVGLVPDLADAQRVDAWSGLRPLTFDGFPMIGRVPGAGEVFVAGGHYRSGVHLAPGTAVAIADMITRQASPIEMEAFRVGKQQGPAAAR